MKTRFNCRVISLVILLAPLMAAAQTIKVATYNIEHFADNFQAFHLSKDPVAKDEKTKPLVDTIRKANDENNWEIAETILDPKFNPDVMVIEEGCAQSDLDYFNKHWLHDAYDGVIVFKSNSDRDQNLGLLIKKGFKVLQRKDEYYLEKDPIGNDRGDKLFARGPVFVLLQTPSGYKFWVGVTHQKSKAGTDSIAKAKEAALWRNREAARTHQIILELAKLGPADVMLLGDMNDDIGLDKGEQAAGADSIETLIGPPSDGLILATQPLADMKQFSFGGYFRGNYQELIDHVVITSSMKSRVEGVEIFKDGLSRVASDHFPVVVTLKTN